MTTTIPAADPTRASAILAIVREACDAHPADADIDPKNNPAILLPVQSMRQVVALVDLYNRLLRAVLEGDDPTPMTRAEWHRWVDVAQLPSADGPAPIFVPVLPRVDTVREAIDLLYPAVSEPTPEGVTRAD